ncbi:hypothetical protein G6F22_018182 [Rhizopus arrhizus]|nr:hypothetical protein G6F22_018182 [Rhizopus arrhizus]
MMRTQLAVASADSAGFLPPHHYDQIFTAHGVIMIFFMAMPFITGLMNIVVPLQIGARDVAYPFLNSLSFWLFGAGVALMMISLFVGEFAATGWLAYPPLSGLDYSPSVGRHQLHRDHPAHARTGHEPDEDADFHVDLAGHQRAARRRLPRPGRNAGAPDRRPLPGHALLHERHGLQRHDVREPDLDLGPPRGLQPDPAGVRRIL